MRYAMPIVDHLANINKTETMEKRQRNSTTELAMASQLNFD